MGCLCLTFGCRLKTVLDEKESTDVILFRNKDLKPTSILADECVESIDQILWSKKKVVHGGQREFSRSVLLNNGNEKRSLSEDFFEMSCTISTSDYKHSKLQMLRAEKVHSSGRLQRPVTSSFRHLSTSSNPSRSQIVSTWADAFEELDYASFSQSYKIGESDDIMFFENDGMSLQDNRESSPSVEFTITTAMPVEPGMVLAMYLTNGGHRFKCLNLDMSLDVVVSTFLCTDNKIKLPVSITESNKSLPMIMGRNQMVKTIAENVGPYFDVKMQGLIFTIGSVNSKLCYKMCLGDLGPMQKILSLDMI